MKGYSHPLTGTILGPFLISAALTGLVYFLDIQNFHLSETNIGLDWAREIATQADGLILVGRERQEKSPEQWAIRWLSAERISDKIAVELIKSDVADVNAQEPEKYKFNSKSGNFNYAKMLTLSNKFAVGIRIHFGYIGFLGTRTPGVSRLLGSLAFCLFFFLLYLTNSSSKDESKDWNKNSLSVINNSPLAETSHSIEEDRSLKSFVENWVKEEKSVLLQMGIHVKNMTREAQELVTASAKSREQLEGVSQDIQTLQENVDHFKNSLIGDDHLQMKFNEVVEQLKGITERAVQNTHQTLQSYDHVFHTSRGMNDSISKSMANLMQQARMVQDLKIKSNNKVD